MVAMDGVTSKGTIGTLGNPASRSCQRSWRTAGKTSLKGLDNRLIQSPNPYFSPPHLTSHLAKWRMGGVLGFV